MTGFLSMSRASEAYASRIATYEAKAKALDQRGATIANLRLLVFLVFVAVTGLVVFQKLPKPALGGSAAAFGIYVVLALVHSRVVREEQRARVLLELNQRAAQRIAGTWHEWKTFPAAPIENHPFAGDLDLVGQGSLTHKIDDTGTKAGERTLVSWLLAEPPSVETIMARQGAVKELTPELDFRQAIVAEAKMASRSKADPSRFIAWAEQPSGFGAIRWAYVLAHISPVFTLTGAVLWGSDLWPSGALLFWGGVAVQSVVVALTRKTINAMWASLTSGDEGVLRFEETFRTFSKQRFDQPMLQQLQRGANVGSDKPVADRLADFARLLAFAELKSSGQVHPIVNLVTLWDVHWFFRMDQWRAREGAGVRQWFDALAQLEALSCFASSAFENENAVFPTVKDAPAHFESVDLGHPLLDKPVTNSISFPSPGHAVVITGSNMSGKTTLMRTMGLNAAMALAGMPVCARSLSISRLSVVTSMRLKDSLERGVSYFYAEVQRVKQLLDAAQAHRDQTMFLLDEIFMGTNTRERQIASKFLLRTLLDAGAIGAVTTHDLTLCELESERPGKIRNIHFRDQMVNGEMSFDYVLRDGVVTTSNALEVLRRVGVNVPAT